MKSMCTVIKEIGSFLEATTNSDHVETKKTSIDILGALAVGFHNRHILYLDSGRTAMSIAIDNIENRTDRRVALLPEYTCESVISPFTIRGWEVYFYSVDRYLRPDSNTFYETISRRRPSVILIHPYYGTDTYAQVRQQLYAHKASLISDNTILAQSQ